MLTDAAMGVKRGLAVLGLVCQGAWMITDPTLRESFFALGGGWLYFSVLAVGGALAAGMLLRVDLRILGALAVLNVALLVLSATYLLVMEDRGKSSAGLSMTLLAVGVTGLLLPARASIPLTATILAAELSVLVKQGLDVFTNEAWLVLLSPLYAAAVGVSAIAGRYFTLAAASRSDEAVDALVELEGRSRVVRAVEGELLARERLLHETALNTLTAIARGGSLDRGSVQRRCLESAKAVRDMSNEALPVLRRDAAIELSSALLVAQAAGCVVDTNGVDASAMEGLPDDIARSVIGALREGILNAARHAQARTVTVDLRRIDGGVRGFVRDDGRGFSTAEPAQGFGIHEAIEGSMALVRGRGAVTSAPGAGTLVEVSWQEESTPFDIPSGANNVAVPILVGFLSFAAMSMLVTVRSASRPWLDVVAFLAALAIGVLTLPFGRTGPLPWWRVIVVCALAPAPYLLQQAAFASIERSSWADWSAEAMVGILLTLACVGPWWTWIPALATWLATMGDPIAELTQPGTAVIVGGALFARSVRRSHRAHLRAVDQRMAEEASVSSAEDGVRRIQRRYARLPDSGVSELLEGIAEGRLDPADPSVQEQCMDAERFLRSMMRLDPDRPLHDLASLLLLRARRRGVPLEIDLAADVEPSATDLIGMRVACCSAVDLAVAGESLRLSARHEGGSLMVRLVGTLDGIVQTPGGVVIEYGSDGSALLEACLD